MTRPGMRGPDSSIDACARPAWPGGRTPGDRLAHLRAFLDPGSASASVALRWWLDARLDIDPQRSGVDHSKDSYIGKTNEQLTGAGRVADHRGSPSEGVENRQIGRAPLSRRGPSDPAHIRSATYLGCPSWANRRAAPAGHLTVITSRMPARLRGIPVGPRLRRQGATTNWAPRDEPGTGAATVSPR